MLKRVVALFLICTVVFSCAACGKKPYDIVEKDGKHYISFNTYLLGERRVWEDACYAGVSLPDFTSIAQMKKNIESGAFDDNELCAMQIRCIENYGLLEICDLDNLYDVRMPEGVTLRQVNWEGDSYTFSLDSQLTESCFVSCKTAKDYDYLYKTEYKLAPSTDNGYDFQETKSYDPEGIQIFYKTDRAEFKLIKYEICQEDRTIYVAEEYRLASVIGGTSQTVPYLIHMFTEEDGAFVYVRISDPTERPSVEWLSSFGVTPYEG